MIASMAVRPLPHPRLIGTALFIVLAVAVMWTMQSRSSIPSGNAGVDPRLVLHPRTLHLAALLDHSALRGTLAPAIPGSNRVRLTLPPSLSTAGTVRLVARMTSMHMTPTRATLARHGRFYAGQIALPMFGAYSVEVQVEIGGRVRRTDLTVRLAVPHL